MLRRIFWIVPDSFGIGEAPDAANFGDTGSDTLAACFATGALDIPNLERLGLYAIDGVTCKTPAVPPEGAYGRLRERSAGKDTTCGHWELAGVISAEPMPTYPQGFPDELMAAFERRCGRGTLCNLPYSGTQVIRDFGRAHEETGALIVYTSADSVFQITAHEEIVPIEELYRYCEIARELLTGVHGVGRVIARPFTGTFPDYRRTSNRHDFSLTPPRPTVLDVLKDAGRDVIGVGKIHDIFAGQGLTRTLRTVSNDDGMAQTLALAREDFHGLCFVNLVDFDALYGHRNDAAGYTKALNRFDRQLGELLAQLSDDDAVIITADHGCDPRTPSTDHSREDVPLLVYGKRIRPVNLGTRPTFADAGATVAALLGVDFAGDGESLARELLYDFAPLAKKALAMREQSYCPHSGFAVGAALLGENGVVYGGCNVENASYPVTCCAERAALFTAVGDGERHFSAIAIAGGPAGSPTVNYCAPCGVCRQALAEFCDGRTRILLTKDVNDYRIHTLEELLPHAFGPGGAF